MQLWQDLASRASLTLSDSQIAALSRYLDLLSEANLTMNLTRIADRASAEILHIADALTVLAHLPPGPFQLADVGTGGGVPGIPLAIARPDARVLLVEATRKKADFLTRTCAALGLTNVRVVPLRAEEAGRTEDRESCDVVVARAVAELVMLVEWTLPLARKGGKVLAMKGQRITQELEPARRAIHMLSGGLPILHPVELPGTQHLVIVEIPKIGRTDARYPRNATIAKGRPLA